jgi:uncharacterized membrane protein YjgN (DUF898 family)
MIMMMVVVVVLMMMMMMVVMVTTTTTTTTCTYLPVLWNPNVHHYDHKRTFRPIRSQFSPVYAFKRFCTLVLPSHKSTWLPFPSMPVREWQMLQKNTGDGTPVCQQ